MPQLVYIGFADNSGAWTSTLRRFFYGSQPADIVNSTPALVDAAGQQLQQRHTSTGLQPRSPAVISRAWSRINNTSSASWTAAVPGHRDLLGTSTVHLRIAAGPRRQQHASTPRGSGPTTTTAPGVHGTWPSFASGPHPCLCCLALPTPSGQGEPMF